MVGADARPLLRFPSMARTLSLVFLATASPVTLVLFLLPWPWTQAVFACLIMGYPVALIVAAVGRNGVPRPLGIVLAALLVSLEACTVGMLFLRGRVLDGPWLGGLPLAGAIQLYGLCLVPLVVVALAYALTFDRFELDGDDVERLAELGRSPADRRR